MSPIRPEKKALYPSNWHEIASAVKEEAGWKCAWCGAEHGSVYQRVNGIHEPDLVTVVLTVAHHPDHDPANCQRDNLVPLCATCHNRLDAPVRAANRKRRVQREAGQLELL